MTPPTTLKVSWRLAEHHLHAVAVDQHHAMRGAVCARAPNYYACGVVARRDREEETS